MSASNDQIKIRAVRPEDFSACGDVLRSLPNWFGIGPAIDEFVAQLPQLTTLAALSHGRVVGFLSLKFHNEYSAELAGIAIREELHRKGIGTTLLQRAERIVRERGCRIIQVKTLGPSHPSPHYARTRQFYLARGFVPLEEFHGLWSEDPCLVMIKYLDNVGEER